MRPTTYAVNTTDVVDEVIDGEAILINLRTGSYYSLEGTACMVWELLRAETASTDSLIARMRQRLTSDADGMPSDVRSFLEEMADEGLVLRDADVAIAPAPPMVAGELAPYVPPMLSKYTDMEALLLIDPIHDVTPAGWPNRPEDGK